MPAAAVIPAPIAYIKVVAVKKLVVEPWAWAGGPPRGVVLSGRAFPLGEPACPLLGACGNLDFYFEEIRVFKAGSTPGYVSMELIEQDADPCVCWFERSS